MKETRVQPFVLSLADPDATLETVGGKGASLAKMQSAGLPVPDGFHITTEAYRRFIIDNALQAKIMQELEGLDPADTERLETASRRIREYFAAGTTPAEIVAAITTAYTTLQDAPVAVRSSATAEDLPGASFAGQQETYLNIHGTTAVLEAVKQCWASLWTARAIAYRLKQQIDQETVALAVVVQKLIFASAAGIMFTANPVSGKRDELVINAAWGLGEAVVSGAVTPDTITIQKTTGRVLQQDIAEKSVMTIRNEEGTSEVPVPDAYKKQAVLTEAQLSELAQLGTKLEQFYGMPMDVEWTLAAGKFAIVQARPITALPPAWVMPEPKALYTRGSLAEHTPNPVTPLFATLGLELANIATSQLWNRTIGDDTHNLIPSDGAYVAINGYVYLGLRLGKKNLLKISKVFFSNLRYFFGGSVERWLAAREELTKVVEAWEQRPFETMPPSELLQGIRTVFGAACHYFTEIQTTLPAAATSEALFTKLYDRLIKRNNDPSALVFLLGFDTVVLRAEKSLFDIANWLHNDTTLTDYILQTPTEQLEAELKHDRAPADIPASLWSEWRQRFQYHLGTFGRTSYEFDFANPTPQETPGPLLDALKAYLSGKSEDPYRRQQEAIAKREQATQAILKRLGRSRKGLFLKTLHWAQTTSPMREDSIFDMGMGHPAVRRMFAELSRRFVAGGALREPDEIYWLEKSELEALVVALEGNRPLPDLTEQIPARKEQWQAFLKINPPLMLPEASRWSRLFHGGEAEQQDGKIVLKGVGTSGGIITAPACILFGPEDFSNLKPGDVLVAVTTTPAWTPLFAQASAVVTDIGGPLSHSSIVAREYGIPAVMAARSATRAIHNGQIITVDGTAGKVILAG